jgi:methylenetetrahydrofolate dehydrogenase (NADP+) / methenyltetrahydrofolate cyclohydrolase
VARPVSGPILLDGRALARARQPELARRAGAVTSMRGLPPRLALVVFGPHDEVPPFIGRKLRACEAVGVEAVPMVLPYDLSSLRAREVVQGLADLRLDGIFLEFPFPEHIDADDVVEAMPEAKDVDVMTSARTRQYLADGAGQPPVTVEAALSLLDEYDVDVDGLDGLVIADASPFAEMFSEAFARRGARMRPLQPPTSAAVHVRDAQLVVSAAARPALLRSEELAPGAVVIDAGYFNPCGRGDIDTSGGTAHLRALAPVPGAIGPMTVSMLIQRVIEAAEAACCTT